MIIEQAIMKAALQAYVDGINAGDAEAVTALFAEDATIEDPVGTPAKRGPEIAAWFADTIAYRTRITPVAPVRGSHGEEAALAFDVEFSPPSGIMPDVVAMTSSGDLKCWARMSDHGPLRRTTSSMRAC